MKELTLQGQTGTCTIWVGESFGNLSSHITMQKALVVIDQNVQSHPGVSPLKHPHIQLSVSETQKSLSTIETLYQSFLDHDLDRSSWVIAVGGGVLCDMVAYAASTYMRGLRFGLVPTTLLAQVDASVGGKNAVNFQGYKNLIGTFRQPEFVLCDFSFLQTLPKKELICGLAEVVKHAAIRDTSLFAYLEQHVDDLLSKEPRALEKVIYDSICIKSDIVKADERESNQRRLLNFGHTVGHAIEKAQKLPHGEAISIGMVMAAKASEKLEKLPHKDVDRLTALLQQFGLPTTFKGDPDKVIQSIRADKKREGESIHFVTLNALGQAKTTKMELGVLKEVLHDLCQLG